MGLIKPVTLPNGVVVNYHRIVSVNIITNVQNTIEVKSYVTKEKRQEEKDAYEEAAATGEFPMMNVFMESTFLDVPYDQDMTIVSAYEYLKEHEGYEDADDVFEEGQPEGDQEEA